MKYQKILIKFSGEAFGQKHQAVNLALVQKIVDEIKDLRKMGFKVAVVCGGGNLTRGREVAKNKQLATHILGMQGTLRNVLPLEKLLKKAGVPVQVYTSFSVKSSYPIFSLNKVLADFAKNKVLIFAGGTGQPFFTTDTAAVLRALEIGAQIYFKATKVNGVYSADPVTNPRAKQYAKISYQQVIAKDLAVIDKMAVCLAWDNQLPIRVIKWEPGNIVKAASGKNLGTLIG
ncbi:MAG: UMP kinase [Candidatus Komeilibacteria bacterium]|nr:UMP kinase [Candidatus Komeilibacteria bacterium]